MLQTASKTTGTTSFFLQHLADTGPDRPPHAWSVAESQSYCRDFARQSYENFSIASWLIPGTLRQDMANIYCYCRWADNLADEVEPAETSLKLLNWWQQQLQLCYSGRPAHPVLVALQSTIRKHNLAAQPFLDLLDAFRQDQHKLRYDSDRELLDYCRRSANPVGRILLALAKVDNPRCLDLADQLCTGLQLSNFCQDIRRDALLGRCYVPLERLKAHACHAEELSAEKPSDRLQSLLREWVEHARSYLTQGQSLAREVPKWLGVDVDAFASGGLAILDAIQKQDFDVWSARPTVSKSRKAQILLSSFLRVRCSWNVFSDSPRVSQSD